ncbi:LytR/AlgR family response regulator transcription factor [Marinifilum fragile]|uniref:LytR/AlgR family response regulator transcription factor n=1 Tax=Marinifilum fragile TaxID=570161 RepID=UPI0006D2325B|nr:LytTR family DNA-binding domain-containing protein [Marinifilum fragile]
MEPTQQSKPKEIIHIKAGKKNYNIATDNILYIEGVDNYIKIKTTSNNLICYESLSSMEKELPAGVFMRIHRSFIININQIDHYTSSYIQLGDRQFTIGRNYKEQVLRHLETQ